MSFEQPFTHDEQNLLTGADGDDCRYHEVQNAPWSLPFLLIGLGQCVGVNFVPVQPGLILLSVGVVFILLSFAFNKLTIADKGAHLRIAFGSLPIFSTSIPYEGIISVEPIRTTLLDGWGLHYGRGGWLWNVWGFDAVQIQTNRKSIRVGTQRPAELVEFLMDAAEIDDSEQEF